MARTPGRCSEQSAKNLTPVQALTFATFVLLCVFGSLRVRAESESVPESSVVRSSDGEVFRSVGLDGVVEFNDYGVGDAVTLDVIPKGSEAETLIVRERTRDILEVALELAADRSGREMSRLSLREERREQQAQIERERLAAMRAAESVYYPARWPLYSPFHLNRRYNYGRGRSAPRYVYAPGAGDQSPGLRHPGQPPPLPAEPAHRRMVEPGYPRQHER